MRSIEPCAEIYIIRGRSADEFSTSSMISIHPQDLYVLLLTDVWHHVRSLSARSFKCSSCKAGGIVRI